MSTPQVTERPEQPYAAISRRVRMDEIGQVLPPLDAQVAQWLAAHGAAPSGPPFWRYRTIDMRRFLQIDVGFPTAEVLTGDDEVDTGVLPSGRYVQVRHTGHPDSLMQATADLLAWADREGLTFDREDSPDGDAWVSRLEIYLTDPAEQPDMDRWETELAFKLR